LRLIAVEFGFSLLSHGQERRSDPLTLAETFLQFLLRVARCLHKFAAQLAAKPFAQMDLQLISICFDRKAKAVARTRTHELNEKFLYITSFSISLFN
jgi:hypothetical protein